MRMIEAASNHGLDIFLLQAFAPIEILLGIWKFPCAERQVLLIDIAQGNHVFLGEAFKVSLAPAPGSNQGHVQLVARRIGTEQLGIGKNEPCGSGESDRFKELAPFHWPSVSPNTCASQVSPL